MPELKDPPTVLGDPEHLPRTTAFEEAMASFAAAYADTDDHARLEDAVAAGRLRAERP